MTRFQEFRVGLLSYVTNSDRGANSSSGFHVPDIDGYRWLAMFLMCLRYSYHGVSIFLQGLFYSYHGVYISSIVYEGQKGIISCSRLGGLHWKGI